jgi:hypothetical protein
MLPREYASGSTSHQIPKMGSDGTYSNVHGPDCYKKMTIKQTHADMAMT